MASIIKVDTIQTAAGGTPTAADLGLNTTGSVLQVVQTNKTDTFSYTGSSFADITGFNATITPSSTSSKILIMLSLAQGESSDSFPAYKILRNSTEVNVAPTISPGIASTFAGVRTQNSVRDQYLCSQLSYQYLDSPASTIALTYKVQVNPFRNAANRTTYINRPQTINDANQFTATSTLILMEIAG